MNNITTTRQHIVWLDVLRFVAILMVIACHCTDPFNASPESRANLDFNFWGSPTDLCFGLAFHCL